ncbi:MAG: carbohydrate-binding protein, partial [Pseudobutyrivibrio sp.]|nr:carbohydrate-binding protein [Pseudobutyrivibrio sp.]
MKKRIPMILSMVLTTGLFISPAISVQAAPHLNPYNTVPAEVTFGQSGVEIIEDNGGKVVSSIDPGDYFLVKDLNFDKGLATIGITYKTDQASMIEVHKDSAEGELLGSFRLSNTNGEYKTLIATMSNIEGMNNIAFVGKLGSV